MAIFDKSKPENAERGGGVENSMGTSEMIKYSCARLMYELVGTGLWTLLFYTNANNIFVLFFGLWILTSFTIRVSGAHFNPVISFAYSLRKDDKGISRKLALAYICAQYLGALAAISTCIWLTGGVTPPKPFIDDFWFRAAIAEFVGSAAYAFFFLMQSDNKDIVSEIETIQCFTLSAAFIAARSVVVGNAARLS